MIHLTANCFLVKSKTVQLVSVVQPGRKWGGGKQANTKHPPLLWIYFCYMHEIMKHWMNLSTVDACTHKLVILNISHASTLNKCFLHLWKKFKKQWSRNGEDNMYTEKTIINSYYKAYMFITNLFDVFTTWSNLFPSLFIWNSLFE